MTAPDRYKLGTGRYRIGRDGVRTTISLGEEQIEKLEKLRFVKGYRPSEVVQVALDVLFSEPITELDQRMLKKRGQF